MPVASVIVEAEEGAAGAVMDGLAAVPGATVHGAKEHQIVVVLEGSTMADIEECVGRLRSLDHVTGVYPVFAADD